MANDLTTRSQTLRHGLPSSLSADDLSEALTGACDQGRLLRAIRDLLGLYWVSSDSPEERARQCALFVADLAEFSDDVVRWAVAEWRRKEARRPTIASLRQLCMVRRHDLTREHARRTPAPAPEPVAIDEAEIERRREVIAEAARSVGMVQKDGERNWSWPEPEKEEKRVPHWSHTASPDDPRWKALQKARRENALAGAGHDHR